MMNTYKTQITHRESHSFIQAYKHQDKTGHRDLEQYEYTKHIMIVRNPDIAGAQRMVQDQDG